MHFYIQTRCAAELLWQPTGLSDAYSPGGEVSLIILFPHIRVVKYTLYDIRSMPALHCSSGPFRPRFPLSRYVRC
jgi:hypothetical protein